MLLIVRTKTGMETSGRPELGEGCACWVILGKSTQTGRGVSSSPVDAIEDDYYPKRHGWDVWSGQDCAAHLALQHGVEAGGES